MGYLLFPFLSKVASHEFAELFVAELGVFLGIVAGLNISVNDARQALEVNVLGDFAVSCGVSQEDLIVV
jgi:hypothetical protein